MKNFDDFSNVADQLGAKKKFKSTPLTVESRSKFYTGKQ